MFEYPHVKMSRTRNSRLKINCISKNYKIHVSN